MKKFMTTFALIALVGIGMSVSSMAEETGKCGAEKSTSAKCGGGDKNTSAKCGASDKTKPVTETKAPKKEAGKCGAGKCGGK